MIRIVLPVPFLALLAGCGDPPPLAMAATPESSRKVLTTALDAWKAGKKPADLYAGSPPLLFIDDDINKPGLKLLDWQIEAEGEAKGTGYSYVVTLTQQIKDGKSRTKKSAYTAVTSPSLAVTKEDRQP
jgi:hypothetical protein